MSLIDISKKASSPSILKKQSIDEFFYLLRSNLDKLSESKDVDDATHQVLELMLDEIINMRNHIDQVKKDAYQDSQVKGEDFKNPNTMRDSKVLFESLTQLYKLLNDNSNSDKAYKDAWRCVIESLKLVEKILSRKFSFTEEQLQSFKNSFGSERSKIDEEIRKIINS